MIWILSISTLVLSAMLIILVIYIRELLKKLFYMASEIEELGQHLQDYSDHMDIVCEMDRYHEEPILENLLKNAKDVVDRINEFRKIYAVEVEEDDKKEEDLSISESNQTPS